jgi:hypothetical protein
MPLDAPETAAYINSRLEHASNGAPLRFPADAAELVHRRSGGVPRIINVICDAALVFGYAEERRQIDLALIRDVVGELEATGVLAAEREGRSIPVPVPAVRRAEAALVDEARPAIESRPVDSRPPVESRPAIQAASVAAPAVPPEAVQPIVLPAHVRADALTRAAEETAQRASVLAGREQAIARRERELAEQRRVLAEEYRLLRNRRPSVAAPSTRAPGTYRRAGQPPRFRSRPEGIMAWFRHLLTGLWLRKGEGKLGHLTRS